MATLLGCMHSSIEILSLPDRPILPTFYEKYSEAMQKLIVRGMTFCIHFIVLADFAGRKRGIMIGGMLFAVGGALQSGAVYLWLVYIKSA